MGVTPTRRVGGSVVTMGSVHVLCCVPGIYPPDYVLTAHENLGKKTGNVYPIRTYQVQNNASRTETREIVLSTPPAGKKKLRAPATRSRVHGWRRDLDRPMCPAGLHVSECLPFCRKVLVVRREKLAKVRKIDYGGA